jgi:hypothetical protein
MASQQTTTKELKYGGLVMKQYECENYSKGYSLPLTVVVNLVEKVLTETIGSVAEAVVREVFQHLPDAVKSVLRNLRTEFMQMLKPVTEIAQPILNKAMALADLVTRHLGLGLRQFLKIAIPILGTLVVPLIVL